MIRILKTQFYMAILILFSSCDYVYDYTYQLTNSTDSEIKIKLATYSIDSIYSISAHETKILFVTDHGVEGSKGPYFDDVSFDLKEFLVIQTDTVTSTIDYLVNSSWDFNEGLYETTITEEEFK